MEWFASQVNSGTTNLNAKLTADVTFDAETNYATIGNSTNPYSGTFDGQGHRIIKRNVDTGANNGAGFFGYIRGGARVKNLILDATCSFKGNHVIGAFAGAMTGASGTYVTFENCVNEASVTATAATGCAAAFVGAAQGTSPNNAVGLNVSNSYNKGAITASGRTLVFCGYLVSTTTCTITNCYNTGTLSTLNSNKENFIQSGKPTFTNCYELSGVEGAKQGIIADAGIVSTGELCYLLNEKSSTNPAWFQTLGTDAYPVLDKTHSVVYGNGDFYCDGLTPKGEVTYSNVNAVTRDAHTFVDGICSVCHQCDPSYVAADGEGFFEIANASQLKWFALYVQTVSDTAKGKLTADIDMAGEGWTGIDGFRGTFDGGSHTISNLGAPFFYATEGNTVVRNLTLSADAALVNSGAESGFAAFICQSNKTTAGSLLIENCVNNTAVSNPSTKSWIGGFVGCAANGSTETTTTVRNCVNNGTISATGGEAVAGFIGSCRKGDFYFLNSTNNGAITAPKAVGGFVGQGQTPASMTFTDCSNTADFTVTENSLSRTGGIIGSIYTCPITTATRCWNTGNISGEFASVGGIVGYMDAKSASLAITDCYNTGNITAGSGAAGILSVDAFGTAAMTITNCWSSGTVTGGNASTPFACSGAVITNCFNVEGAQENVTTVTAEQLASGEVAYKLNGDQTAIVWFETIGTDAAPSFSGETVYKTSDAGWGTFFDTEKAYAFTGVKAYTGKIDGSVLKLTEVSQANAGTPVILEGTYYNKVAKATPAEMPENDLKGTTTDLTADGSQYVLAKKDDVVGFYQATEGTIAAGKAYLTGISASVKAVTFGTIDGIVSPLGETEEGAAIYDLSSRRVEKATKGLYIINGKKVLK